MTQNDLPSPLPPHKTSWTAEEQADHEKGCGGQEE
jgi:hypothetical protein